MRVIVIAALLVGALVHLAPLAGVLGVERLRALYGVDVAGPDLALLLRHRAVLFGLLGAFSLAAIWMPAWRLPALALGAISIAAFLALYWSTGGVNANLSRVAMVDLVALPILLAGLAAHVLQTRGPR